MNVNGASDHICTNLSWFLDYKALQKPTTLTIPDGRQIPVAHIGSVPLNDHIVLHNLIFVLQLCKDLKCHISFTHD